MQRIVKRFLLHKQRETDEVNEFSFEELKQDMQMIRYEMNHDVKKTREDIMGMLSRVDKTITLIGNAVLINNQTPTPSSSSSSQALHLLKSASEATPNNNNKNSDTKNMYNSSESLPMTTSKVDSVRDELRHSSNKENEQRGNGEVLKTKSVSIVVDADLGTISEKEKTQDVQEDGLRRDQGADANNEILTNQF